MYDYQSHIPSIYYESVRCRDEDSLLGLYEHCPLLDVLADEDSAMLPVTPVLFAEQSVQSIHSLFDILAYGAHLSLV